MYNDLLGNANKETNEAEIKLHFKRSLIDDLYALHGEVGIKTFLEVANELLKKATVLQIRHNLKENENYYSERANEIIIRVREERHARNKS